MKNLLRLNFLTLVYISLIIFSPIKSNAQQRGYSHLSMEEKENKCLELIEQAEYMVEGHLAGYDCGHEGEGEIVYKFKVNHWYKGEAEQMIDIVHKLDTSENKWEKNRSYNLAPYANYMLLINQQEDETYRFAYSDSLMILGFYPRTSKFKIHAVLQYGLTFDNSVELDNFLEKIKDIKMNSLQDTSNISDKTDYFFEGKLFKPNVKQPELLTKDSINLFLVEYIEKYGATFNWSQATDQLLYSAFVRSDESVLSVGYTRESGATWVHLPYLKKYSVLPCEWMETRDAIIDYVVREESKYRETELSISDVIHHRLNFTTPNVTFSVTDPTLVLKLKQHPAITWVEPYYFDTSAIMNLLEERAKNKKD